MSSPSTPFPWKGDARRAGVAEGEKSEANLRRYAPPPSGGRREKQQKPIYSPFIGKSVLQQVCL